MISPGTLIKIALLDPLPEQIVLGRPAVLKLPLGGPEPGHNVEASVAMLKAKNAGGKIVLRRQIEPDGARFAGQGRLVDEDGAAIPGGSIHEPERRHRCGHAG